MFHYSLRSGTLFPAEEPVQRLADILFARLAEHARYDITLFVED